MVSDRTEGRFLDDGQSYRAIVAQLPREVREEYDSYGSLNLEAAFPNRKLVVYTLRGGQACGVELWRLGDISLDRVKGPICELELPSGEVLHVGVLPHKVGSRDVFIHMPQNFTLKWKGKEAGSRGVQFVPHYAVLTKTRSKAHHQVEGHTYVETLNKFRERFPDYPIRY